jgi:predicted metal-dependent phosphoesterase TrpH
LRRREAVIHADLHVHTNYSSDSSINPKTLVEQLRSHPTIRAIAITDHDEIEGYFKTQELAAPYEDVLVIPGMEITTPEGDIIVLGVAELPPKPWNVRDIVDFSKERGGVVIVAHPYREYGLGNLVMVKNYPVDAIEVMNGGTEAKLNRRAENLAEEMGLPGVAGSDAHKIEDLWTAYTEIEASLNLQQILKAVRKGLVKPISARRSIHF